MDIETVANILAQNLEQYDRSLDEIRHSVAAYEIMCTELISLVGKSECIEDAQQHFDDLYKIQGQLSGVLFTRNIDIGSKMTILVKEFDRLYDPYIREYWFKRFSLGECWPE